MTGTAVSGCAARSKAVTLQPVTADMSRYKTVVISVESRVPGDVTKEKAELEGLTVSTGVVTRAGNKENPRRPSELA